jgi:hypothetical protein
MDNQSLRNIQQNIATTPVKTLYADEIVVAHTIKAGKDKKGKVMKEGHLHLVFIDMTTQRPIDKIAISPITAMGLHKALGDTLLKIDKELKNKKLDKRKKTDTSDYIR